MIELWHIWIHGARSVVYPEYTDQLFLFYTAPFKLKKSMRFSTTLLIILVTVIAMTATVFAHGEDDPSGIQTTGYYHAKITQINTIATEEVMDYIGQSQEITVQLLDPPKQNTTVIIQENSLSPQGSADGTFAVGDRVIVFDDPTEGESSYSLVDHDRTRPLIILFLLFFGCVVLCSRWRGFTALIGLLFSIFILARVIVPAIINGQNPIMVSFIGALCIAIVSLTIGHGWKRRTGIALCSTMLTIVLAAIIATVAVKMTHLLGLGSEGAFYAQFELDNLNMQGLLIGGMIIGALGILDDVTTAQTAAVEEIYNANPRVHFKNLYKSSLSVGKEHIVSLVNTLALAYAGAALPMFLLFAIQNDQPFWVVMSSEFIAEEVVRTLVGSITLVAAVPISTVLAAGFFTKRRV